MADSRWSEREELARVMAKLGGLSYADELEDGAESLFPYYPEADAILEAGFRRDAEPSEDAIWKALEPFLETSIRLDLNELEDNQSFAEMVKAVAVALKDPEAERTENREYTATEPIFRERLVGAISHDQKVADSVGPVVEGDTLADWLGLSETELQRCRDERSIVGFRAKDSESFLYPVFQFNSYGEAIPKLASVLSILDPCRVDDGSSVIWLNRPLAILGGRTAVEGLRDGEVELVISAARGASYGWQTAPVEYEYGWAPYSYSDKMLPTEEEAKERYFMAVGHPVRRWKREIREAPQWILAEDQE